KGWSEKRNIPVADAPKGRRDDFVDPYFKGADLDAVVIIRKAREPARIMTAIGDSKANRWHLQIANRWVVQYNFYINDRQWGRMFVRICPYLPFSARVCLNQHHWLANRMREEGIDFQQCANAFTRCAKPERLQQLADSLTPWDLLRCGQKWLAGLPPFFTARERQESGCRHRLFFSQVEFCDNLIFRRRAALDKLGERLLDANRTIGQPQQDHRDLRAQDHSASSRQAADRNRGPEPAQPGDPQPLWQRFHQAVCPRSPDPAHRSGQQQRQRLRRQEVGAKSPRAPQCAYGDQRQLSQCPAGHPGDLHQSWSIAQARR